MSRAAALSLSLGFLAGFVDAAAFVALGGLFVAHVTGNFVLLGAALAGADLAGHGGAQRLQLLSFPIFFAAAMLATFIGGRTAAGSATLLWLGAVLVAGAGVLALALPDAAGWAAMVLVAAMATLNAAHRLDPGLGAPFTVMTGNVTGFAVAAARRLLPGGEASQPPAAGLFRLVLAFAAGCAAGALGELRFGLGAVLAPCALLVLALASGGRR